MSLAPMPAGNRGHLVPPYEPRPVPLALSGFDTAPLRALVKGAPTEVAALIEDTRLLAQALASDEDGDKARVRLAARCAATARAQQRILENLLMQAVTQRDAEGVQLVDRALHRVNQSLAVYLKQLAHESALRRRPAVHIGYAEQVAFAEVR